MRAHIPVMLALFANALLLLPMLATLGTVLLLVPPWLGDAILFVLVTVALIGVPLYAVGGAVHAFVTAPRDLRRGIADAEAYHRAILARHAPLRGTPAPVRRHRLGEAD